MIKRWTEDETNILITKMQCAKSAAEGSRQAAEALEFKRTPNACALKYQSIKAQEIANNGKSMVSQSEKKESWVSKVWRKIKEVFTSNLTFNNQK